MSTKVKLTQLVAELIDSMDLSAHHFRRLYNIGVGGARKFNMDIYGAFKSVELPVSANHTVAWPADYLDYSKIGVVDCNGIIVPFKHNENLTGLRKQYITDQCNLNGSQFDLTNLSNYWLNYGFGTGGFIHLYGIGGGTATIGEFNVDDVNKCFRLDPCCTYTTLALEYLSGGLDCSCNEYMVDIFAAEAMKWWIRWMNMVDLHKKYSRGDVAYAKGEYLIQKRDAKARINKARINEMEVISRKHVKLVARA